MKLFVALVFCVCYAVSASARQPVIHVLVRSGATALPFATVRLLTIDSLPVTATVCDTAGNAHIPAPSGMYRLRVSMFGYADNWTAPVDIRNGSDVSVAITLLEIRQVMAGVTITSKKPLLQLLPDRTVVNVEAGITNSGATVMEVLEKSPGVVVDREGTISLKGRTGVVVMIDGRLTQLSGTDLQSLLNGISASQVESIELIDNPSARFDAAGNAGIINIRMKKNKQAGLNSVVSLSYGQGKHPKTNNNLALNYRKGNLGLFVNYNWSLNRNFTNLYALRDYKGTTSGVNATLRQNSDILTGGLSHTFRAGLDYSVNKKTSFGMTGSYFYLQRTYRGHNRAEWKNEAGYTDSTIITSSDNSSLMKQAAANMNARHRFSSASEWTLDLDYIHYDLLSDQFFRNHSSDPQVPPDASDGHIPSRISILTAKTDYSRKLRAFTFETGLKTSLVKTDNLAEYQLQQQGQWYPDYGKSNHFLYTENIHASYINLSAHRGRFDLQAGLRYEYTRYNGSQLGNNMAPDSIFKRRYGNLFPSSLVRFAADSLNSFSFRAGRRIDRPAFQKLNPFVIILNKYTYQQGNPYFNPQFTWNLELSHTWRDIISTTLRYNITDDYFSQIFYADNSTGIIVYTEGNIGKMTNIGISVSAQLTANKSWSASVQADLNHKNLQGQLWKAYNAEITQANFNLSNQFSFGNGWSAELSGFYTTRSQNDLQEVVDPNGQVSAGVAKQLMRNQATLRLALRDLFYTQRMQGMTDFDSVTEFFRLTRDSRVATLSFTWRFGKTGKQTPKRSTGGAGDVMERVGNIN
ncbi:MAG: TonB-dependent receptor [Chitinophagaceae bacterium]|nr:MAG: TonB-dependent receptor [Chitinophagaceae bacterium]